MPDTDGVDKALEGTLRVALTPIFAGRCLSGLGIGADPCRDVARDSVGCVVGDSVVRLRDHGRRDREGVSLTGTGILGWP